MSGIRIEPASAVPWADVEHSLTGGGDGASCWCQWYRVSNAAFRVLDRAQLSRMLRDELADPVTPGFIAYVGDEAVGWCRVSSRTHLPRLAHTNVVTRGTAEPMDDALVWAVTCFVVRREHRRAGVARALLARAIEFASEQGARVLEAYPVDLAERTKTSVNTMFTGTVDMFREAGFDVVSRPKPGRAVMTLSFR